MDEEGEPGLEGEVGLEGDLEDVEVVGSNLSTKRQKSMLELLELAQKRVKSPDFDHKIEKSLHKLSDFTQNPTRYARQQRITLTIRRAGKPELKKTLTGYFVVEHRDQYDAYHQGRRVLVESDKTVFVVVGNYVDQKNILGRDLRKSGAEPITTLADTLNDLLGLEVLLEPEDKD